jgi:hypothetical protein
MGALARVDLARKRQTDAAIGAVDEDDRILDFYLKPRSTG